MHRISLIALGVVLGSGVAFAQAKKPFTAAEMQALLGKGLVVNSMDLEGGKHFTGRVNLEAGGKLSGTLTVAANGRSRCRASGSSRPPSSAGRWRRSSPRKSARPGCAPAPRKPSSRSAARKPASTVGNSGPLAEAIVAQEALSILGQQRAGGTKPGDCGGIEAPLGQRRRAALPAPRRAARDPPRRAREARRRRRLHHAVALHECRRARGCADAPGASVSDNTGAKQTSWPSSTSHHSSRVFCLNTSRSRARNSPQRARSCCPGSVAGSRPSRSISSA